MYILAILSNIALLVELLFLAGLLIVITYKCLKGNPQSWLSSLFSAVLVLFVGVSIYVQNLIPYPYIGFLTWWSAFWFVVITVHSLRVRRRLHRSMTIDPNDLPAGSKTCEDGLPYKHEWMRKTFHLAGFLLIVCYYVAGPIIAVLVAKAILGAGPAYILVWGPLSEVYQFTSPADAGNIITLLSFLGTIILASFVDVPRVLFGEEYSLISLLEKRAGKILREKERGMPGPYVFIAVSATAAWIIGWDFSPIVSNARFIAIAAIMISTLADGAAAVFGKAFGRHVLFRPFDQKKSIEGFIAGFVTAFVASVFFIQWWLALAGALLFLALDYLSPPISDNVVNATVITLALCCLSLL
jgi:dolichol kinase